MSKSASTPLGWASVVLVTAFVVAPTFVNPYQLYILNLAMIYALLAVGLNVLLGYAGQLAFSNIAIFGAGAYFTAILKVDGGLGYHLAMPLGAVAATLVGTLVALPALRLRGLYLALLTLAFAEIAHWTFSHWESVTRGTAGIIVPRPDFSAIGLQTQTGLYFLSLLISVGMIFLIHQALKSWMGRAFIAVRESDIAAASVGINAARTKTLAFAISAAFAGTAGGLLTMLLGLVTPDSFATYNMIVQFSMVVLGGLGSVAGAVLGAILLVWSIEVLRVFRELQEIVYGGLLLVTVLFFRDGLIGWLRRKWQGWEEPVHRTGPYEQTETK